MANRRAALTDLAAQLPAAVLADLLHLSPRTAVHWSTPGRSRLVRLRGRTCPDQQSPALTNTSHPTASTADIRQGRNNALYSFDAGVDLRDVQIAARHADPRTTMRYDRARKNLDRHPNYILAAYMASGT